MQAPIARWLVRGALVAAVCSFSVAAWAQGSKSVAPPPADLEPLGGFQRSAQKVGSQVPVESIEPGVNTSATQPSSPDTTPAPAAPTSAPAPAKKPAPTPARPSAVKADAAAPASSAPTAASTSTSASTTAGTTPAPKSGAPAGKAHDKIELDTTQITGNRELPKVLYIVPWKRSDLGDLVGKPVNSLLDEVLTPVDRDVFKRQNRYYDALKPDDAKDAAGAATGATEKR
jgi:hypothetical protein